MFEFLYQTRGPGLSYIAHLSTKQERSIMKTNTKYQGPRPNEYEKNKTHNFNRGLGP